MAFSQCMYSRGELVPGYAPVVAAGAAPDPTVRSTQAELNRLGYLHGPADGYAGGHTRAAISSFEQANGLPVDGTASASLLAKLQSTPTQASAAAAPANWVAPAGSSSTAAPAGWVAPTASASAPTPTAVSAPSGWVAPARTQ